MHVSFDESDLKLVGKGSVYDGACVSSKSILKDPKEKDSESTKIEEELDQVSKKRGEDHPSNKNDLPLEWKTSKVHPIDNILGVISKGVTTCSKISNLCYHFPFVSQIEPKNSKDTLLDEY